MKPYALYTVTLLAFLLAGCASFVTPKTPDQRVLSVYGLYTAVESSTSDLLSADAITVAQAQQVQSTLQDVRPMLDTARETVRNGVDVPQTTLDIVTAIQQRLLELQTYLQSQQVRP